MRPLVIVDLSTGGDHDAGMIQAQEQRLVEQLVARATVEALDVAVLHRLARCDVVPLDADLSAPGEDRVRCELGAIIADDHPRLTALGDEVG